MAPDDADADTFRSKRNALCRPTPRLVVHSQLGITIKWKADKATPILQTSSTISVTDVTFGGFNAPWGVTYGQFSLGTSGVTGAFTGGDNGATSSNVSLTGQDIAEILAECGSPTGLKKLNVGLAQLRLQ
jgi:hypothetical protein